jgi:hypothetical protein
MLTAQGPAHHWYALSWVDWLSVGGFPLALLGIYFAWQEARKATSAATAARLAVDRTQRQLRANQLLVLVPQLRWISTELEQSINDDDRDLAGRNLHNWRWQAGHVHGILSAADPAEKKLLKTLQDSVGLAFAATTTLLDAEFKDRPVLEACMKARESIGNVCNQFTSWVGQASTSEATDEGD